MFLLKAQSIKEYFDFNRNVSEGIFSKIKLFSMELMFEFHEVSPCANASSNIHSTSWFKTSNWVNAKIGKHKNPKIKLTLAGNTFSTFWFF